MNFDSSPVKALALSLAASCLAPMANANDALVVYIECSGPEGKTSQGSGVLVSENGHVLTAAHVIPDGSTCQASIGNNSLQKRGIRKSFESRKINADFDATLMEFGRNANEVFSFATACPVTDDLKGREIIAKGFDKESFGAPDVNDGILSNTTIDFDGMVQMTAETINGKSGGPVFLKESDKIVGIIAGAQFTPQGIVSSYKMLAVDAILTDLDVLKQAQSCDGTVEPTGTTLKTEEALPETTIAATVPETKETVTTTTAPEVNTGLADPNFPDHVTGYNATYVEYGAFHFQKNQAGDWEHHDKDHNLIGLNGVFFEYSRDEYNIVLVEYFTDITVRFDGMARMIYWSNGDERAMSAVK